MRTKIMVFAAIVAATLALNATFDTAIHPLMVDQIAVSQLEDSDAGAVAIRAYDRFASNTPLYTWGLTAVVGAMMFYGDVRRGVSDLLGESK